MDLSTLCKRVFFSFCLVCSSGAFAAVNAGKRHVLILQGGVDRVWANFLFSVENTGSSKKLAEIPVMMAKEKLDFVPQEGVTPEEIRLGEGGSNDVMIEKTFSPGPSLLGFSYNAPAKFGKAVLTFEAPYDFAEFIVLTDPDTLTMEGTGMEYSASEPFAGRNFQTLRRLDVKAGEVIKVELGGVNQGRQIFWVLGVLVGLFLFVFGGLLAWRGRPKGGSAGDLTFELSRG